ncbi:hypothetical protein [Luteolibacter marinus]|uniref:hypothetical protein n=1 Tax=Luteolibacter marinus TaxID=2776705 RepID=UPI001865F06C|nr:hypothetical protein [Luteolibacter marinus]
MALHPITARSFLAFCLSWLSVAGETIEVPVTTLKIARPAGRALEEPVPRPLLMVRVEERGETFDDPMVTSYWTFDPASPGEGLRKKFSGPGNDQYLRFITPLFGGWGLACGRLDSGKEPADGNSMFWFDLVNGRVGEKVGGHPSQARLDEQGLTYERHGSLEGTALSASRVVRLDPLDGTMRTTEMPLAYSRWLDHEEVMGVARIDGSLKIVRLHVGRSRAEVIGGLPEGFDTPSKAGYDGATGVYPAGGKTADGVYAISGFGLWFLPEGGEWHRVAKDVHIVKTFGGVAPQLPVRYLGNGRFAVARTTRDEVPVPDDFAEDEQVFGAAEAVTMLIDGRSGERIAESAPVVYNHNPPLEIPGEWWAPGYEPAGPVPPKERASRFQWEGETRTIRFAGDRSLKLEEGRKCALSGDGRLLLVYEDFPKSVGGKTTVTLQVADGESGEVHRLSIASEFPDVMVEASWQVLCAEHPDPQLLRGFRAERSDPFREPWGN